MSSTTAFRISAIFGFLAVALGAFGAHLLKDLLARNETAAIWQTAVFYHMIHAVVMLFIASRAPFRRWTWWLFASGVAIFGGSLYLLALTGIKRFGAVTPIGGVCLLAGWVTLAVQKNRSSAA